jgi:hypothetical protein
MNDDDNKVYQIELVVAELQHLPHTYETILGGDTSKTKNFILRRKLNNLCKQGIICKSNIPGTRFGKCIFYLSEKKYYILVEAGRMKSEVFFFFKFKKLDKDHIKVDDYFYLDGNKWIRKHNKVFFGGRSLLFL